VSTTSAPPEQGNPGQGIPEQDIPAQGIPASQRSARGRRAARPSGDDRERAILHTAERLLEERSLGEIAVDDLARGAGISRPAFYFYFSSKDAVVLTLLDRVVQEAVTARDDLLRRLEADPSAGAGWREGIEIFYATFGEHRAVIRAASELSPANTEARELWSQVMEGWVENVTEKIEQERERGLAPAGAPARALATALVQLNERAMGAVFIEEVPALAESEVIDTLAHVWLSAIYGAPPQ
jgi:TetR/AcrR family transcriptional regulator, ethionamide resistance regulator